jgi:hypothetical protein
VAQIEDARARAYAARAARRRKMSELDFSPIARGGIFTARALLPTDLVARLRADAKALDAAGAFVPSGLSSAGHKAPFGPNDRLVRTLTPDVEGDREARRQFDRHLHELRRAAGAVLGRTLTCAEQYYSIHRSGAVLQRHMDEKHEELKGGRGWQLHYRRSVSWLFYLSDEHTGGEFRGFCPCVADDAPPVGAHEGNVQVGWLAATDRGSCADASDAVSSGRAGAGRIACSPAERLEPVFMDSWLHGSMTPSGKPPPQQQSSVATPTPGQPLSALYRVLGTGERDWLTGKFDAHAMPPPSEDVLSPSSRAGAIQLELPAELRSRYSALQLVPHKGGPPICVVDVAPVGGTMVLFDSVAVPHEVLSTTSGERVAMAGWFHEAHHPAPDWFDGATAPHRKVCGATLKAS